MCLASHTVSSTSTLSTLSSLARRPGLDPNTKEQLDVILALLSQAPGWAYVLATLGCVWVARRIERFRRRRKPSKEEKALRRRQRRAERAEIDAAGVLRARGFTVLDDQVEFHWEIHLDGEPRDIELRADYLVSRGRKRYVAEVKSGQCAPSISTAATRRQLLEYRVAYPVDGILLVDMEAVKIHVVDFGDRVEGREPGKRLWRGLMMGIVLGVVGCLTTLIWLGLI